MNSFSALITAILVLNSLLRTAADVNVTHVTSPRCQPYRVEVRTPSSPDPSARYLEMSSCHLTQIKPEDLSFNLPNLELIWLNNNRISHVDLTAFKTLPSIKILVFGHNTLAETPIFNNATLFPNLITLYLHENLITEITEDCFSGLVKLQKLYLRDNLIEYIHPNAFKPMTELNKLLLNNNKISYIADDMFANNEKLGWLSLEYNRISYLPLNFVASFRSGAGLHTFSFGNNPWQCPCLLELLLEVTREGVRKGNPYGYEDRFNGKTAVCWYSGKPCYRGVSSLTVH